MNKAMTKIDKLKRRLAESASTDSKRVHITSREHGWAVRKESNIRPTRILPTQKEAIKMAKEWLKSGSVSMVVVHSDDGRFRSFS